MRNWGPLFRKVRTASCTVSQAQGPMKFHPASRSSSSAFSLSPDFNDPAPGGVSDKQFHGASHLHGRKSSIDSSEKRVSGLPSEQKQKEEASIPEKSETFFRACLQSDPPFPGVSGHPAEGGMMVPTIRRTEWAPPPLLSPRARLSGCRSGLSTQPPQRGEE